MPDLDEQDIAQVEPSSRPSRRALGLLSIIGIAVVGLGIWLFGGDDQSTPTIPELPSPGASNAELAPDFSVTLFSGERFRLSQHFADDGRPVVLNLWASWCFPCREEMPDFDEVHRNRPDLFFIGVAVDDDPIAAERFAEEVAVSYALAADEAETVNDRYPAVGLPATFFIDADGKLVRTVFGQMTLGQLETVIGEVFGD